MRLTIILPTYNNDRTIKECLDSIFSQKFPRKEFEVLFVDGGSDDKTLSIAKKYPVKIINNPKRNEEAARILGINKAKGEIIGFIDADNVLIDKEWFRKMLEPFKDKNIFFADTLYYSYRKNDRVGTRYQALIGGDDPIIGYVGAYSRYNYLTKKWTDYPYSVKNKKDYLHVKMKDHELVPPMGSNGFLVRKEILKKFVKDTFVHSDFVYDLINKGHNSFAKVKTGIVHNQPKFFPNKIRRAQRRADKSVKITYNYGMTDKKLIKASLYIILILPILYDTLKGFIRKPDSAWFFHPVACLGELFIYAYYSLKSGIKIK